MPLRTPRIVKRLLVLLVFGGCNGNEEAGSTLSPSVIAELRSKAHPNEATDDCESCLVFGDYDCDGKPEPIAASREEDFRTAIGWLEPAGCFTALGCDGIGYRDGTAECVEGRCELVDDSSE